MTSSDKIKSRIIGIIIPTIILVLIGLIFDFYYDLNDDVLMKDIMSGIYTGKPDIHNIQMMYPLTQLFCLLYRYTQVLPWMGIVEMTLIWWCLVCIFTRVIEMLLQNKRKAIYCIVCILAGVAVLAGGFLWELINIQYTVVCGLLVATAAFLVYSETETEYKISDNIIPIIMLAIAFNVRSEMFLLMCPFLLFVGVVKWIKDGINVDSAKQYVGTVLIIGGIIAITLISQYFAYFSPEWKEYSKFFDARTQVYDFTGIPDYETNSSFYDSIYVSEDDVENLKNYNFVFSPVINATSLEKIADYAKSGNAVTTKQPKGLGSAVKEYIKGLLSFDTPSKWNSKADSRVGIFEDNRVISPLNIFVLFLYILIFGLAIYEKRLNIIGKGTGLFAMRSISWIYIILKDRVNARVAHPLYIIELLILIVLLSELEAKAVKLAGILLLTAMTVIYIPVSVANINQKAMIRESMNKTRDAIYSYTASNPTNYFYLDVYTTTGFTEKLFEKRSGGKGNTQLAGGWIALSPLDEYKKSYYRTEEKMRFITETENESKNPVDVIDVNGKNIFVYKIEND